MARPRKFDPDIATGNLMDAFWRAGYEATSLADLMAATGLQKGSLYAAFGDKRAMYLRGLATYDAQYVDTAVSMMAELSGRAALLAFLELPVKAVAAHDRRGCFLCNASTETAALDKTAQALANKSRQKLSQAIHIALVQVSRQDAASGDLYAQTDQILALYFGMRTLARSNASIDRLHAVAKIAVEQL